jgi:hypothetical protein
VPNDLGAPASGFVHQRLKHGVERALAEDNFSRGALTVRPARRTLEIAPKGGNRPRALPRPPSLLRVGDTEDEAE